MPKNPTRKIIYICVGCGQSQANCKYNIDKMVESVSARDRQPHTMKNDDCKIRNFSNETRYNDVIIQIESVERLRNTIDSILIFEHTKWAKHEGRTKSLSFSENCQHIDFQQQIPYLMVKVGVALTANTNIYVFIMKIAAKHIKRKRKEEEKNASEENCEKNRRKKNTQQYYGKIKATNTSVHPLKKDKEQLLQ